MIPRPPLPPQEAPYPNEDLPDPGPDQGANIPVPDDDDVPSPDDLPGTLEPETI